MSAESPPNSESGPTYRLVLFVAGDERNSRIARENLERICREDLIIGNLSDADIVRSALRIRKPEVIAWKKTAID